MVDPSHGTGIRDLVIPMSLAGAACGADGLLVEVHENPAEALSDGAQSLYPAQFEALMSALVPVVRAVGRDI
jgi:3-deoxy-7-phosphoheptulonate synthase